MISDEEFLEYVRQAAYYDEFAQETGWVRIGTLAEVISQRYRFYNTDIAEVQILRLEKRGLVKVWRCDGIVLGAYPCSMV